jgi:zeaxanthin glucosyltransferase
VAHFAFIAPPFLGHLNPMLALAGALVARGHRATFLAQSDAGPWIRGAGIDFAPVGRTSHPEGSLAAAHRRMARVNGVLGLSGVMRDLVAGTTMLTRDVPGACRALAIDMIVADQTEAAGGLVARHLDLPYVSVANALPLNQEPGIPPPFTSWSYERSDRARRRNLAGYRVSDFLMRPLHRTIAEQALAWRLGPLRRIEDCASSLAQISQTVESFDFPREHPPPVLHHVGPLRRAAPSDGCWQPPARDGRPLAFASLGTLQGGRATLFRRIARGAEELDVRLVLAHGGGLGPRAAASLPGRPAVFDFVPQEAVLREARLAILHGGLNTVMDALAAGTPIAVAPIAFEQGAIAARIVRCGAGLRVRRLSLTAAPFRRAMQQLLETPSFAEAARRLADEIAAAGGVARAANLVEIVLRTGRPVLAGARTLA